MAAEVRHRGAPAGVCGRCHGVRPIRARGVCASCYTALRSLGQLEAWPRADGMAEVLDRGWRNPLVCVCEPTAARAGVRLGECLTCHRKPLALFSAAALAPRPPRRRTSGR